jgi:hypothetical protein
LEKVVLEKVVLEEVVLGKMVLGKMISNMFPRILHIPLSGAGHTV